MRGYGSVSPESAGFTASPLTSSLWRASLIGLTLLLVTVPAWLLITARDRTRTNSEANPRRARFSGLWATASQEHAIARLVEAMGPPDEKRQVAERIPDCGETCGVPCERYVTCVVEYEWSSAPPPEGADIFSACADVDGIVRRTSQGMRFNINSSWMDSWGIANLIARSICAVVCALPVTVLLRIVRHRHPYRLLSIR